ncbi:MAG: LptF/LptG family permease, partial [Acidobacteriota bacterium]|nr:LptF/LptG family permease [Acidobacteriota bacterium]
KNIDEKYIFENVGQIRFAIKTKRGELIDKLSTTGETPDELGLRELARYALSKQGKERTEAQILWQRRIILSITPLIFAILGTAIVLRFNRGGRGFGIFLALISLVFYYLITLFGEQLARTNKISVLSASAIPVITSFFVITWFFLSNRLLLKNTFGKFGKSLKIKLPAYRLNKVSNKNSYIGLNTGILDFDIIFNLLKYFLLTFIFITSIYMIFTAFELWKFAGETDNGLTLLAKYLFYLVPFIYIQLAPSALMIATLATFVIKSRQNEIVTWTSAGQSVYRLLFPCFILMILLGFVNWGIQEVVAPKTNKIQDELRALIRGRGVTAKKEGKFWVANGQRIFSFEIEDIKKKLSQKVKNLSIYEFSEDHSKLQTIYRTTEAVWEKNKIKFSDKSEMQVWTDGKVEITQVPDDEINEKSNPFNDLYEKPSHLNTKEIKEQINKSESETERKNFEIALEKKYTTMFLPFVITLFTAPFALSISRKGRVVTVGYAVGVWLLFMAVTNTFEQFGLNGYIASRFAVWSPLFLFSIIGVFLLSKVRT